MLVISVFLLGAFITWQWYIENKLHRPPLMRLALFTRGKGRLAVVYAFIVSIRLERINVRAFAYIHGDSSSTSLRLSGTSS
jgi:hypothetical protein